MSGIVFSTADQLFRVDPDGRNLRVIDVRDTRAPQIGEQRISPDGRSIAFARELEDFSREVVVCDSDGRNLLRLVSGEYPAWSPDGARLAFAREENSIRVVSRSGGPASVLIEGFWPQDMSWTPDGRLLITTNELGDELIAVDTRTGLLVPVPWPSGDSFELFYPMRLSPDGTKLLLNATRRDGDHTALLVMDATTFEPIRELARVPWNRGGATAPFKPCWSPDGTEVAYLNWTNVYPDPHTISETAPRTIWRVSVDGGEPSRVFFSRYRDLFSIDWGTLAPPIPRLQVRPVYRWPIPIPPPGDPARRKWISALITAPLALVALLRRAYRKR